MELAELNNKTAYPIEGLKYRFLVGGSLFWVVSILPVKVLSFYYRN